MKTILFRLLLLALVGAAPPLQLETRTPTPLLVTTATPPLVRTTTPPLVVDQKVITKDPPVNLGPQTTDMQIDTLPDFKVMPQVDFVEIVLTPVIAVTEIPDTVIATVSPFLNVTEIITTTANPPVTPAPRLSGKEREALIAHLTDVDLTNVDTKIVLSPRQKLALTQELDYKRLGLPAFDDPTPWQRLTRGEQQQFNEKFLSLRPDLQEYSKVQFTSLPEERQEHAYRMFLHLDIKTLTEVIHRELERQVDAQKLYENESIVQKVEEPTSNNFQEHQQDEQEFQEDGHHFQETQAQVQENLRPLLLQTDNSNQDQGPFNRLEDSQNQFQQQPHNPEQLQEPRQQFQISEQQLQQLQQQIQQLEEPGQQLHQSSQQFQESHQFQESQQFQESRQKQTEQVEQHKQTLQLSSQHLQQLQQELQLLDHSAPIQREEQKMQSETEEVKKDEQELGQPGQTFHNQQTDISEVPDFDFEQATKQYNQQTNDFEQQTESSVEPYEVSTQEFQQAEQQTEKVREPFPHFQQSSIEFQQIGQETDRSFGTQQQETITEFQEPEEQTEEFKEFLHQSTEQKEQQTEILEEPSPHFQNSTEVFKEFLEQSTGQKEQQTEILEEPSPHFQNSTWQFQQQPNQVIKSEQQPQQLPKHTGLVSEPKQQSQPQLEQPVQKFQGFQEFQQNELRTQAPLIQQPTKILDYEEQQPKNVFLQQNEQITELRKEFRLSAKKFSQNLVGTNKKFEQPAKITLFTGRLEQQATQAEEQLEKSRTALQPITPQFLQPPQQQTKQHQFQQSTLQQPLPQQFQQQIVQPVEPNIGLDMTEQQFQQTIKQFQNAPRQAALQQQQSMEPEQIQQEETSSNPIHQLQKISQDFKLRSSQSSQQIVQSVKPNIGLDQTDQSNKQFQNSIKQFQNAQSQAGLQQEETSPNPIRHLQKISQDFKLRSSQKNQRTRSRPIFDPRIRQQQDSRKRLKLQNQTPELSPSELRHFQKAEAQLEKAIRLQECHNNPSSCQV